MQKYKEIAFVRLRRDPKQHSNILDHYQRVRSELKQGIKGLLEWSFHMQRCELRQTYLIYENKAVYNNGIVVKKQLSGDFMVQLVTSVPRDQSIITLTTPFAQLKNHINYTYEQVPFQANPVHFFESIGYKVQSSFEYKDVEYFRSLAFGVEIVVYPKHGYLQIIETYSYRPQMEAHLSAGNQLLKLLSPFLDETIEVILSSGNMKPQDFAQQYT